MNLTPYVERLQQELADTVESVDAPVRVERLSGALDSATRLVLLDALSAAASEITRDLAPSSVELRLRGLEPEFVVAHPPAEDDAPEPEPAPPPPDEGATSRINLRLPEQLKLRVEEAAAREGLSVNGWLVRVVAARLGGQEGRRPGPQHPSGGERYTGWVR